MKISIAIIIFFFSVTIFHIANAADVAATPASKAAANAAAPSHSGQKNEVLIAPVKKPCPCTGAYKSWTTSCKNQCDLLSGEDIHPYAYIPSQKMDKTGH